MSRRRRLPNFLRASEIDALLAAAQAELDKARTPAKKLAARRDLVILQTGLFLGLRVSELCRLKVEDLDLVAGACMVRQGKNDKDRALPIPARLAGPLKEWVGGRQSGPVFPGRGGKRLSPRTVQLRVNALGRKADLPRRVKPHTLRHSFATRLLERNASIREVQELMGHSSVSTTEVYTHVLPERLRGAVDRL